MTLISRQNIQHDKSTSISDSISEKQVNGSIARIEIGDTELINHKIFGIFTIPTKHHTERRLSNRQAQLLAMGGCIGTALFITMGSYLAASGPLPLLLAYIVWCSVVYGTNCVLSEMTIYLPVDSSWIVYITRYIDEAIGVANGWNYFLGEVTLVCYEVTAFGVILEYWTDKIPTAVPIVVVLSSYIIIELFGVNIYGEIEFWLAIWKVLLITMLICYTFFTMVGANPKRWAYGFHYWKDPGVAADYLGDGGSHLSYFEGFLACLINASFTIAGPDYVSMTAGEVKNPRVVLPKLFKTVIVRLFLFFVLGALSVGIVCPYNSEILADAISSGSPGAGRSPYVVSMKMLGISGLPDFVNAVMLTTIYSSGNGFFYCATRSLYGMACENKAPKIFKICLKNGAPVGSMLLVAAIGCLSFLQLGNSSQTVLTWFVYLSTSSLMIYMALINAAYIRWRQALKAQGISWESLPYKHKHSHWIVWYSMIMNIILLFLQGYSVFKPGNWSISDFLFAYFMIFFVVAVFIFWKFIYKRNKWLKPEEIDIFTGKQEIDDYEENYKEPDPTKLDKIIKKLF